MVKIPDVRQLRPKEAAQFVLDDIRNDRIKLQALQRVPTSGDEFDIGNRVFHEVYGTLLDGNHFDVTASFKEKVYKPLGFEVYSKYDEGEFPEEPWMIYRTGELVKQL